MDAAALRLRICSCAAVQLSGVVAVVVAAGDDVSPVQVVVIDNTTIEAFDVADVDTRSVFSCGLLASFVPLALFSALPIRTFCVLRTFTLPPLQLLLTLPVFAVALGFFEFALNAAEDDDCFCSVPVFCESDESTLDRDVCS